MVEEFRTVQADVLVVGAGGAGAWAALEADRNNVSVVVAEKGLIGKAGCTTTTGNRAFGHGEIPMSQEYIDKQYKRSSNSKAISDRFKRIIQCGCYLNDQDLVWIWVNEAPGLHREMRHWATRAQDSFTDALNNEIERHPGIHVMEYAIVTKLLTQGGKMVGATGLDIVSGEFILFKAKSIVLACGGYGELYNPAECTPLDIRTGVTGDGVALAYNVGCELVNVEMAQQEIISSDPKWSSYTRHDYTSFQDGVRVGMHVILSDGPFYDKDGKVVISREEFLAMPEGCAPPPGGHNPNLTKRVAEEMRKGPVYINLTEVVDLSKYVPSITGQMLHEMDYWDPEIFSKLRVALGCLIGQGGPKINEKCETNVAGLYGAGEGCGSGNLYGAYRPGGSFDLIFVFGKIAGKYVAEYAKTAKQGDIDLKEVEQERSRVNGFLEPKRNSISPIDVKKKIFKITGEYLSVLKNEKGLKEAIKEIEDLRKNDLPRIQAVDIRRFNLEWMEAIEVPFMLDVAEMIAWSSLFREESRGVHNREDYPKMDNENWLCHTLLVKKNGEMKLSKTPVKMTRFKPPSVEECIKGGEPIPI